MYGQKSHWKPKRRFGISGGINKVIRKSIRPTTGRPFYRFRCSLKHNDEQNNAVILKLTRQRILKAYNRRRGASGRSKTLINSNIPKFTINKMSNDGSLKYRIKKLNPVNPRGYRMMNLQNYESHIRDITSHSVMCNGARELVQSGCPSVTMITELRTHGLASVLQLKCNGCDKLFTFETSPKSQSIYGRRCRYDINLRAVWGCCVTGNGASHLNEIMATMDSPGMTQQTFTNIEQEIGTRWGEVANREFLAAGAEERNVAVENGQFYEGVPSVSVIADGGWSKRTHKHSYNALGGVGVIIGKETGKILFMGVRNKYCFICSRADSLNEEPKPHICFKNWNESSQAMESDVIVEGFQKAESMHGVRYMNLIADGDSSVFAKIQEDVPIWGKHVNKLECANHMCKCLRSSLEKLVEENPHYKGRGKLTKAIRIRLVSAVRCAIRMRSTQQNIQTASRQLAHDIKNSIHHIFGNHTNCSDFCRAANELRQQTISTSSSADVIPPDEQDVSNVCTSQYDMWQEGTSIDAQEQSRLESDLVPSDLDDCMLQDVSLLLQRMAAKSERLLGNNTTNLAEAWMHMRCKFDGGKVLNICRRGSWHTRCYGSSLRMNLGPQWSPLVWEEVTGTTAGYHFEKLYVERDNQLEKSVIWKHKPEARAGRWKRKMDSLKQSVSKKARMAYGDGALDATPDISPTEVSTAKSSFLAKHIECSDERIIAIERLTRDQSSSNVWHQERRKRITSSSFGSVVKRQPSRSVTPLVRRMLYGTFKGNCHTRRGLQQERVTTQEYILKMAEDGFNVTVQPSGLIISLKHKFLAASPDGRVSVAGGDSGLLEIKNLLHNKSINLTQAAKSNKSFCLQMNTNQLTLKPTHDYFYQCQGLVEIANVPWIDFVVRTVNPYQLHVERIYRDTNFFASRMLPKLSAFYHQALLPELAAPREGKVPGIREPGLWFTPDLQQAVQGKSSHILRTGKGTATSSESKTTTGTSTTTTSRAPSTSTLSVCQAGLRRQTRSATKKVRFVGRRILHEWQLEEASDATKCYKGTVLGVMSKSDGDPDAIYEVLYDGDNDPYEVDDLYKDYTESKVQFIDLL